MSNTNSSSSAKIPGLAAIVAIVLLAVQATDRGHTRAGVRSTPERAAFKSGAARQEEILREIASTLKSIDRRLERLERTAVTRPAAAGARNR